MILCNGTEPAPLGGYSLVGVMGRTVTESVPTKIEPLVAAFRLRGAPREEFQIQVDVFAPDDTPLRGSETLFHRMPPIGVWDSHVTLSPLTFRSFGTYRVVLKVNLNVIKTTQLNIEQLVH